MRIKKVINKDGIEIKGLGILEPNIFEDSRGIFYESWNQRVFNNLIGENVVFVQDNKSISDQGVLRGLHYQMKPNQQAKLVSCELGEIYDVALDIRKDSPTFGSWAHSYLSSNNKKQFWIPNGFAHGFLTLSDKAIVSYKTTNYWHKDSENSIIWNDDELNISWPINELIVKTNRKDQLASTLKQIPKSELL
tara:strand:+ start:1016 stop:1591 length:576 start_codon:yes stop_codon:yes gene_type:complete